MLSTSSFITRISVIRIVVQMYLTISCNNVVVETTWKCEAIVIFNRSSGLCRKRRAIFQIYCNISEIDIIDTVWNIVFPFQQCDSAIYLYNHMLSYESLHENLFSKSISVTSIYTRACFILFCYMIQFLFKLIAKQLASFMLFISAEKKIGRLMKRMMNRYLA